MKVPEDFCTVAFLFLKQHELTHKDVYIYFTNDIYSIYIYVYIHFGASIYNCFLLQNRLIITKTQFK